MSNLPKLSNRAKLALEVLADGGQFRDMLERDSYTGFEKWRMRLLAASSGGRCAVVKGIGRTTFYELEKLGMIVKAGAATTVSNYYKLRTT